jgi:hypothetical protein
MFRCCNQARSEPVDEQNRNVTPTTEQLLSCRPLSSFQPTCFQSELLFQLAARAGADLQALPRA